VAGMQGISTVYRIFGENNTKNKEENGKNSSFAGSDYLEGQMTEKRSFLLLTPRQLRGL
jgi:hypothetical protein